jgi:putative acetyltransferase
MKYTVRPIEKRDDAAIEAVIRACLVEFGANHAGTAWTDPDLCRFSEIYGKGGTAYFVAEDGEGRIVGGVGIGVLPGVTGVCELQKMYCLPEARGTGLAHTLITLALDFARPRYARVYLETLPNMHRAQRFYEKHGFRRCGVLGNTGHTACDVCYIKDL